MIGLSISYHVIDPPALIFLSAFKSGHSVNVKSILIILIVFYNHSYISMSSMSSPTISLNSVDDHKYHEYHDKFAEPSSQNYLDIFNSIILACILLLN
jgi:hypothetical protein